jgi:membrane protease YdiL (CAAX protease family)
VLLRKRDKGPGIAAVVVTLIMAFWASVNPEQLICVAVVGLVAFGVFLAWVFS